MDYLELSYVWGKRPAGPPSSDSPTRTKAPLEEIPSIIADAMTLVVSLGYQYLWVDRFCIDQDDLEKKHLQISQMDEIYEGAMVTIVAAVSNAVDKGTPGVSIPRVATPRVQISRRMSLQGIGRLKTSFASSEWNSRGWTYQEFCLSRRCLVLADDQVHFICSRGMTCEGVEEAALGDLPVHKGRCLDPGMLETNSYRGANLTPNGPIFARHLSAYTKRVLPYGSDAHNAFRGILARSWLALYWGVPVFATHLTPDSPVTSTAEEELAAFQLGFLLGLYWRADRTVWLDKGLREDRKGYPNKRQGFPSWSWLSSRGVIEYASIFCHSKYKGDLYFSSTEDEADAEVFLDDPSISTQDNISGMTEVRKQRHTQLIPEGSPYIYIKSVIKAIPVQEWLLFRRCVDWDCGAQMEHIPSPLHLILLITEHSSRPGVLCRWYMAVKMEGDIARRVGLARIFNGAEEGLITVYERNTIKVA